MSRIVALSSFAALSLVLGANVAIAQNVVARSPPSELTNQNAVTHAPPSDRTGQAAVTHSPPSERASQSGVIDPNERKGIDPNFHFNKAGSERMGVIMPSRK